MFNKTNPSFAMQEGWAEFLGAAVPNNPAFVAFPATTQTLESNTFWKGGAAGGEDGTTHSGEIVEGAVASIFWDIFDPAEDTSDDDEINKDFQSLWDAISLSPATFREFWDKYMLFLTPSQKQAFQKICQQHGIVYSRARLTKIDTDLDGTFENIPSPAFIGQEAVFYAEAVPASSLNIQTSPEPITGVRVLVLATPLPDQGIDAFIDERLYDPQQWQLVGEDLSSADGLKVAVDPEALGLQDGGKYVFRAQAIDENGAADTFYPDQRPAQSTSLWLDGMDTLVGFYIADPLFLVGGRKLIFLESAIENAENQGILDFVIEV